METKELIQEFFLKYQNSFGGFKEISKFDTGNPNLESAYYCLMLYILNNKAKSFEISAFKRQVFESSIKFVSSCIKEFKIDGISLVGIPHRFPIGKDQQPGNVISHDEITGMALIACLTKKSSVFKKVVDYGILNDWFMNEKNILAKGKPSFKVLKYFWQLWRYPHLDQEIDKKYPSHVVAWRYKRRLKDRAAWKLSVNVRPTMLENIALCFNLIFRAVFHNKDYAKGSSSLLAYSRAVIADRSQASNWLIKSAVWFYSEQGPSFTRIFKIYFKEEGHPLVKLIKKN